jgi:hypothetical protein
MTTTQTSADAIAAPVPARPIGQAIVVSCNSILSLNPESTTGVFAPLVDRPFLQHVVEAIIGQGIRQIYILLRKEDHLTMSVLGDGTRWGARFQYHRASDNESIYDALQQVPLTNPDEHILLAHSDRLPLLSPQNVTGTTTLFCWKRETLCWTGWGVIRAADMLLVPNDIQEQGLFAYLKKSGTDVVCTEGVRPLTNRSYDDLLESNRRVLSKEFPGLVLGGKEVQPGVWLARNARVHPTARLAAPAFLGENCRIGALAQVGPAVSIGKDCTIERETRVADSVVYRGSYVGPQLALKGVVVDRSRLISTGCDAEIEEVDELLLGSVFGLSIRSAICRACRCLGAAAALVIMLPCLLIMIAGSMVNVIPPLRRRSIVKTPSVRAAYRWKTFSLWSFGGECIAAGEKGWVWHFFYFFLPSLVSIATGNMDLTGPRPRGNAELSRLTAAKFSLYLQSRPGILQPESLYPGEPDGDIIGADGFGSGKITVDYAVHVLRAIVSAAYPLRRGSTPQ